MRRARACARRGRVRGSGIREKEKGGGAPPSARHAGVCPAEGAQPLLGVACPKRTFCPSLHLCGARPRRAPHSAGRHTRLSSTRLHSPPWGGGGCDWERPLTRQRLPFPPPALAPLSPSRWCRCSGSWLAGVAAQEGGARARARACAGRRRAAVRCCCCQARAWLLLLLRLRAAPLLASAPRAPPLGTSRPWACRPFTAG